MLGRFLPLLLCLTFLYGGCQLFKINDGKTNDATKAKTKALCDKGEKANAVLESEYTEMKIAGTKTFLYDFHYRVGGEKFEGSVSKNKELTIPIVEILYDPDNPASYTTNLDPCASYAAIKDNPGRWPNWFEYAGVGIFLLGLGMAKSSVVNVFKGTQSTTA